MRIPYSLLVSVWNYARIFNLKIKCCPLLWCQTHHNCSFFCHCVQKTTRTTERRKKIRARSLVILFLIAFWMQKRPSVYAICVCVYAVCVFVFLNHKSVKQSSDIYSVLNRIFDVKYSLFECIFAWKHDGIFSLTHFIGRLQEHRQICRH